jgi:hypothetical protein
MFKDFKIVDQRHVKTLKKSPNDRRRGVELAD